MSGLSSDDLTEDYKASLEDLSANSRFEISNLTVIARENIHAAQSIARVLEQHILKTAPSKKLPALYLLDSIAKNVGSPYTIYFQRDLYSTFMEAYKVVDGQVRRKLEEMFQTWKQPVPGSTSTQPVFSPESTRKIDTALIRARTAALQAAQKQRPNPAMMGGPRHTPPPPAGHTPPPFGRPGYPPPPLQNGQRASQISTPPPASNLDILTGEIARLIETMKLAIVRDPSDQVLNQRLSALVDLQELIKVQKLPDAQLAEIRDQIRAIAQTTPQPPPPPPPPQPTLPPAPAIPNFSTQDLAAILASATAMNNPLPLAPVPPQFPPLPMSLPHAPPLPMSLPHAPPPPPPPPPPLPQASAPMFSTPSNPNDLFASLQKAGLLPGPGSGISPPPLPVGGGIVPPLPFPLPGNLPHALPGIVMPKNVSTPPMMMRPGAKKLDWRSIDVEMNTQSLKTPRPHLVAWLNEILPKDCSSCARRFENSEKGTREKQAHLDWHFRVRTRMVESVKRGQNRCWYVDEEEWIRNNEEAEDIVPAQPIHTFTNPSDQDSTSTDTATSLAAIKKQYVVVPNLAESHRVCPICQEEVKYVWHETDQFVWMDAKQIGPKIYHASCHAEASKDRIGVNGVDSVKQESRGGTPDNAGVKRKAEDTEQIIKKMKQEHL
ncbi:hypothetical protein EX30DRAFT_18047 [Ascodesmis nigricans]|uniref:CID domain-containing protein n=1 Tax=Ascodesmis nigricans TaxID=341454 RepID=A0A4S2N756_9PEZI|nr:hypothetical protein EX30DRAFT_18047 [Ascodesmis nigricans]